MEFRPVANFQFEKKLIKEGHRIIAGVDEVGRGALFGPVVAVAVTFPAQIFYRKSPPWCKEINDSKLLSPTKRMRLARLIIRQASALGIGIASNVEVDEKNVYQASHLAMKRAIQTMGQEPDVLLVDGFPLKDVDYFQMNIFQGDKKSFSIAAASIVAKVFRDDLMAIFDVVYSGYGFSRHKGYGTKEHYMRLRERGPTCLHRMTFKLG